ncbi:hypothetical protein PHYSODRAFT_354256 [Phytophthora sojae]|uniref:RxLR effector protein n=2 Tax=Phytophthora sojae TaxID=67593 RepID=G4Z2F8_PHYSP|nr:hypothetical protein PHYSODRAFT_354256 [Phytophthora sojae]AAO24655.1 unknown protein [Phytophthora sojae]EGZ19999.1 hypothetical protein PHYSODRAFT_354256 [Phytophthora sojae]|eukprot:XP_009522716.1 hypothetical protein PHYSODRAFT_354256 [Phytophthora sojae]
MVRLLALASLLVVAVVSLSPAAAIPDPMAVAAKATNVAMDTSSGAADVVKAAAKLNTSDTSQLKPPPKLLI